MFNSTGKRLRSDDDSSSVPGDRRQHQQQHVDKKLRALPLRSPGHLAPPIYSATVAVDDASVTSLDPDSEMEQGSSLPSLRYTSPHRPLAKRTLSRERVSSSPAPSDIDMVDSRPPSSHSPLPWNTENRHSSPSLPGTKSIPGTQNDQLPIPWGILRPPSPAAPSRSSGSVDNRRSFSAQPIFQSSLESPRYIRLPSPIVEGEDDGFSSAIKVTGGKLQQLEVVDAKVTESDVEGDTTALKGPVGSTHNQGRLIVAMGYRPDCEKCRNKVPGHYNHIIRV